MTGDLLEKMLGAVLEEACPLCGNIIFRLGADPDSPRHFLGLGLCHSTCIEKAKEHDDVYEIYQQGRNDYRDELLLQLAHLIKGDDRCLAPQS